MAVRVTLITVGIATARTATVGVATASVRARFVVTARFRWMTVWTVLGIVYVVQNVVFN